MNAAAQSPNASQVEYWNAQAGNTWAELHDLLDRQILPLGERAIRVLAPASGERILDVGCGCGQTTLQLAQSVGPTGRVMGIDISRPMLEMARSRRGAHSGIRFLEMDAQLGHIAAASGEPFDGAFSRFGVMFFSDPVAAFANIRSALRPGGRLCFVCWRPLADNPWMRVPMEAAAPLLPELPPPADPHAPGPFAFADPERVGEILRGAGYQSVRHQPFDARIGVGDLDQTLALTFRVGPLGAMLREHPEYRDRISGVVRSALAPFAGPEGVSMPAAVWIFSASNP